VRTGIARRATSTSVRRTVRLRSSSGRQRSRIKMRGILTVALAGTLTCSGAGGRGDQSRTPSISVHPDTAGVGAQLERFLTAALESTPAGSSVFKDLQTCLPDAPSSVSLWVGDFRTPSFVWHGDTLVGQAPVVSIAEQKEDSTTTPRSVVFVRVRTDTLHWPMVFDSTSGRWKVCGFSTEGYDLGSYGLPTNTRFVPTTETRATLRARADSLRRSPR
jgi:hypothetical protein